MAAPPTGLRGVDLLDHCIDHIAAHPDEWGQWVWWCGTAGCLAGHICAAAGDQLPEDGFYVVTPAGERRSIPERAAELIGVYQGDADLLFDAGTTLDEMREIAADLRDEQEGI